VSGGEDAVLLHDDGKQKGINRDEKGSVAVSIFSLLFSLPALLGS